MGREFYVCTSCGLRGDPIISYSCYEGRTRSPGLPPDSTLQERYQHRIQLESMGVAEREFSTVVDKSPLGTLARALSSKAVSYSQHFADGCSCLDRFLSGLESLGFRLPLSRLQEVRKLAMNFWFQVVMRYIPLHSVIRQPWLTASVLCKEALFLKEGLLISSGDLVKLCSPVSLPEPRVQSLTKRIDTIYRSVRGTLQTQDGAIYSPSSNSVARPLVKNSQPLPADVAHHLAQTGRKRTLDEIREQVVQSPQQRQEKQEAQQRAERAFKRFKQNPGHKHRKFLTVDTSEVLDPFQAHSRAVRLAAIQVLKQHEDSWSRPGCDTLLESLLVLYHQALAQGSVTDHRVQYLMRNELVVAGVVARHLTLELADRINTPQTRAHRKLAKRLGAGFGQSLIYSPLPTLRLKQIFHECSVSCVSNATKHMRSLGMTLRHK